MSEDEKIIKISQEIQKQCEELMMPCSFRMARTFALIAYKYAKECS